MNDDVKKISYQEASGYIHGNLADLQLERIRELRKSEPTYHLLFDLLDHLKATQRSETESKIAFLTFESIDDMVTDYLSGNLERDSANDLLGAVLASPVVFRKLLILLAEATPELKYEIEPELKNQLLSEHEFVDRVTKLFKKKTKEDGRLIIEPVFNGHGSLLDRLLPLPLRIAASAIVVIILCLVGISFFKSPNNIQKAQALIAADYRISIKKTPRLSGGYASKAFHRVLKPDTLPEYIAQARRLSQAALEEEGEVTGARHMLAKTYLIEAMVPQADTTRLLALADSIFDTINPSDVKSVAALLNDRGVASFLRGDSNEAEREFASAIKSDSVFSEPYYNLALLLDKLDRVKDADKIMQQYLKVEQDENWRNAGLRFLQRNSTPQ